MWYPATVKPPAPSEPLSVDEVKRRLRIDFDDDDADIDLLIASARDHVEKYCGLYLSPQTVEVKCDAWADLACVPIAPVNEIASISYVSADGSQSTLSTVELRADGLDTSIVPAYGTFWPATRTGSRITLTLDVGFAAVPPAIKHAMLLFIGDAYEVRENSKIDDMTAFDALLCNYRR